MVPSPAAAYSTSAHSSTQASNAPSTEMIEPMMITVAPHSPTMARST